MTADVRRSGSPALFALLALAVYGTAALLLRAPVLPSGDRGDALAIGAAVDLTLLVPLLYWLLVVRPKRLSPLTVIPVAAVGAAVASFLVPEAHRAALGPLRHGAAAAEGVVVVAALTVLARKLRAAGGDDAGGDRLARLRDAFREVIPARRAADAAAWEVALLGYALAGWRWRPEVPAGREAFAWHRRSGYVTLLAALVPVALVEMVVVHLLVERWSVAGAWTLTGLSLYGALWLVGWGRAVVLRPHLLDGETLRVRVGMGWTADVPLADVAAVERPSGLASLPADRDRLDAVPIGRPDLVVHLARPVEALGAYGMRKRVERIALAADERERFAAALEAAVVAAGGRADGAAPRG